MTAANHGKSKASTNQRKRVELVGEKRSRGDDENDDDGDGTTANKKRKPGDDHDEEEMRCSPPDTRSSPYGFIMKKWDPTDFFSLLEKGEEDVNNLGHILIKENRYANMFKKAMKKSLDTQSFRTEAAIDAAFDSRFTHLTDAVESSSKMGENKFYFGL